MEFCPNCEKRLASIAGIGYQCPKCDYTTTIPSVDYRPNRTALTEKAQPPILLHDSEETRLQTLPTIHVNCPKCDNATASFWTQAVGTDDDVAVIFLYRCTQCGYRWRQEE